MDNDFPEKGIEKIPGETKIPKKLKPTKDRNPVIPNTEITPADSKTFISAGLNNLLLGLLYSNGGINWKSIVIILLVIAGVVIGFINKCT